MRGWLNIASVAGEKAIKLRLVMFLRCRNAEGKSIAVGELVCDREECCNICWNGMFVMT